ncbi:hypothetical protein OUZ56_025055 [Daphnia magna]|uniref:Uncharacterized protein n=1 Tax=Daphnia magna TaxID=35525 RepID=A0ABQ9ZIP5_9CRUS|nr:hypothetical protein OUZ56_025055 [Daphnia magna]
MCSCDWETLIHIVQQNIYKPFITFPFCRLLNPNELNCCIGLKDAFGYMITYMVAPIAPQLQMALF